MAKTKQIYTCEHCDAQFAQWSGQCTSCGKWNSIAKDIVVKPVNTSSRFAGYAGEQVAKAQPIQEIAIEDYARIPTGLSELDRVLGGGLVNGSVVLIGGDPGIGKSTVLLQTMSHLSESESVLYVTGEESLQQVSMRAKRLGLEPKQLELLSETRVENIIAIAEKDKPRVMVIDSIQTVYTEIIQSAPGGVGQIRESAAQLVQFAKRTNTALFLVGHVTKEGTLAGPRVLEHMVDTVLYFEGQSDSRFRVIRAVKNRYGAVNELGIFAMTDKGLREVSNPSAIFLSRYQQQVPGSAVMVTWEGSRPLLVEVQALVDSSHLGNPRRVTLGLEGNRLSMLLAVLHRHGGVGMFDQDVFVNVVGGVRVTETASDLAVLLAILSSFKDKVVPEKWVVFGEIGLAGEIRPVPSGLERIREAAKHGFDTAIVPKANAPKKSPDNIKVIAVENMTQVLGLI